MIRIESTNQRLKDQGCEVDTVSELMALPVLADLQSWLPPFVEARLVTVLAWVVLFSQYTSLGLVALRAVGPGAPW